MPSFWQPSIKISTNENLAAEKIAVPYIFDIFQMVSYHAGRLRVLTCHLRRLCLSNSANYLRPSHKLMQQPLISKPHPDNSAQAALNQAAGGGAGVSQGLSLQDILISISLSPGQAALNFPNWWNALMGNQAILSRSYTHLIVILLAILAVAVSNIPLSWGGKALRPLKLKPSQQVVAPPKVSEAEAVIPLPLPRLLNSNTQDDVLVRAAVPHTIIPDRSRAEISTYVVQSGDTIFGIAAKFGLEPETLMWANQELNGNPDWLCPLTGCITRLAGVILSPELPPLTKLSQRQSSIIHLTNLILITRLSKQGNG